MTVIIDGTAGITFPVTAGSASAVQASSGRVLQVVSATYTTETSTTLSTAQDTGLTISITPSSSSNKILIIAIHGDAASATAGNGYNMRLLRGASVIGNQFAQNQLYGATGGAGFNIAASQTIIYLDSPATTSSTTYKTQFWSENGSGSVTLFRDSSQGYMIAMEIAA